MSPANLTLTFLEPDNSSVGLDWENFPLLDLNYSFSPNASNSTVTPHAARNYFALLLLVFPFLTLFGNVLVILAVFRERSLQTATNYYIISLALADLLVAVVVMPFAVYFQKLSL
ncbi:dopamine D2-like receptor [Macrosteles quadrilineatus]|uniref:dopamine D2-like receptor n=1 Tax=Macrosteles quadrilineatus TaxID=74068 RepID=UPI0023E163BC|nr:dopamine D2-like receptor [Macrosteles quadrilineatus]